MRAPPLLQQKLTIPPRPPQSKVPLWRRFINTLATLAFCKSPIKIDRRPRVDAEVNGHKVRGLLDSGADITCLKWEEFLKMGQKPRLRPYHNRLSTASGEPMQVMGAAPIEYRLGKTIITWNTVVVRNMKSSCILGMDFMEDNGVVLDAGKRRVTIKGGGTLKLYNTPGLGLAKKEYKVGQYEAKKVAVVTGENPGTKMVASGPWVDDGIIEIDSKGEANVLFYNRTCEPVTLKRATPICRVELLDMTLRESEVLPLQPGEQGYELPWTHLPEAPCDAPVPDNSKYELSDKNLDALMINIPAQWRPQYKAVIRKYGKAFSKSDDDIGKCEVMPQRIRLDRPDVVISRPPYRIPYQLRSVAQEYVHRLLRQGVIVPSQSPFSSPLMLVKKPGADNPNLPVMSRFRVVHDYRELNRHIIRQNWPLTDVQGLVDDVCQGRLVSCLDISSGFFNQMLTPDSQQYTGFSVSGMGHYMYTRSPMGVVNSASSYQMMIQYITQGIKNCLVFVDDLAIVTDTHEEHLATLEKVLQRFVRYGLKIRVNKLQLVSNEVTYMGFRISPKNKTVKPSLLKTQAIIKWKEPQDIKEIRQFVGLCSYFRRVCKDFSRIAQPLTKLTRKDSGYTSGKMPEQARAAFYELKKIFSEEPTVPAIDYKKQFVLITDASGIGAGAILAQRDEQGREWPVAYASKTWSEVESRRAPFHLEAAALIFGVRTFRNYLLGRHFWILSDHRPLSTLHKSSSPILDRIYAELEEYSFTMKHLPGKEMPADGLSRAGLREVNTEPLKDLSWGRIRGLQEKDKYIKALVCWLKFKKKPDNPQLAAWVREQAGEAVIQDGIVGLLEGENFRILAPLDLRETLLAVGHDHRLAGHQGYRNTYLKLRQSWSWPNMAKDCEQYCRSCTTCARVNVPGAHTVMPLRPLQEAKRVNARVHLDLLGPMPRDRDGNKYCVVMVDAFSNWVEMAAIPSKDTSEVATAFLNKWICSKSIPEVCVTDNGGEFDSGLFRELNERLGIIKKWTSSYHPQSNAVVERRNRDIVAYIRKFLDGNGDKWSELLTTMSFALNTSVHPDKGMSAFQIVYGQRPTLSTDSFNPRLSYSEDDFTQILERHFKIQDSVRKAREAGFERQKKEYDKHCHAKAFLPGMVVYAKHVVKGAQHGKFQVLYDGPFIVVSVDDQDNVTLRAQNSGRLKRLHANRLKHGTAREQWMKSAQESHKTSDDATGSQTGSAGAAPDGGERPDVGGDEDEPTAAAAPDQDGMQPDGDAAADQTLDSSFGSDIFGTPVAAAREAEPPDRIMTRAGRTAAGRELPRSLFSDEFPKLE